MTTKLAHTVRPGERFHLADVDPAATGKLGKKEASERLEHNLARLNELQEVLYAEHRHALLIVLQAMDTAGKDGTIGHVLGAFNPQGMQVTPFKAPTEEELSHDFLWRVHRAVPPLGMVGVFNRSHYEDVLVVRVKKLVPQQVWRRRYQQVNDFERMLVESGVTLVKLFLHISPEEQAERLRERQVTPDKQWKFNPGDLEDRKLWKSFMAAYEDALSECNTAWAPWFVVPADHKWYRNLAVSELLVETLESLHLAYVEPVADIGSFVIPEVR